MTIAELVDLLQRHRIQLWREGDRLRYRAPAGAMTPELRSLLSQHKSELLIWQTEGRDEQAVDSSLSEAQQALWFIHQAAPESAAYNVAFAARLRSTLDVAVLRQALEFLVARHGTLRTTYHRDEESRPFQRVHPKLDLSFESVDATQWSKEELNEQVAAAYRRPFDLEQGPLLRVCLYNRGKADHVLLIVTHHIAADGWSMWLLLDELRILYAAERRMGKGVLPDVPSEYLDYVRWQQSMLSGPSGERHWRYWQERLIGAPPVLELTTDRPRPPIRTMNGATLLFSLPAELTSRAKSLAQSEGVTLYTLLLATFFVLLRRHTGQDDLSVGAVMSGRTRPEFENILGCFVNSVPVRIDLSDDPPFAGLLQQVRKRVLEAIDHQEFPFRLMTRQLNVHRNPSVSPLFQVDFLLQKPQRFDDLTSAFSVSTEDRGRVDFGGLALEAFSMPQQEGQLDLTLELIESGSGELVGSAKYNTDLFYRSTVTRFTAHYRRILEGVLNAPETPISRVPLLSLSERGLIESWAKGRPAMRIPLRVAAAIAAQARRRPEAIAVMSGSRVLRYECLDSEAEQLAKRLRKLGVGPDVRVGLLVGRSPGMVTAILGILKAGGAYVPIDPSLPPARIRFVVEDADPLVILTHERFQSLLPPDTSVLILQDEAPGVEPRGEGEREKAPGSHGPSSGEPRTDVRIIPNGIDGSEERGRDLAYVLYTSGSTGVSKGVMIEHRAFNHFVRTAGEVYGLGPSDRVLQFASLSFDTSIEEIFPCLACGGTLVLRSSDLPAPRELLRTCEADGITVLDLPTAYWHELVPELTQVSLPESVRLVILGGEAARADRVCEWHERVRSGVRLVNTYGPTEATVVATMHELTPQVSGDPAPTTVPIGRPLPGVEAYVLDRNLEPVPIGVPGELFLGGAGLARGYLGQSEETAERFLIHRFDGRAHRLYRTGDRARWLPDGALEFLGRTDRQVKIRGFRVEPDEIEHVLETHPDVEHAVVLPSEEVDGPVLQAYTALRAGGRATPPELRDFLRKRLPGFMLPRAFHIVPAIPLTAQRKVDRAALLTLGKRSEDVDATFVPPETQLEEQVAAVWSEALGLEPVGVQDTFFQLGGHSLLAVQVVSRLSALFNVEVPLRALLVDPTVRELSTEIEILLLVNREQPDTTGACDERELWEV